VALFYESGRGGLPQDDGDAAWHRRTIGRRRQHRESRITKMILRNSHCGNFIASDAAGLILESAAILKAICDIYLVAQFQEMVRRPSASEDVRD
jgi:hypothetical protein